MPFLAEGIRTGEKCICILETLDPPEVMARLGQQNGVGNRVAKSVGTGQLELGTPAEAYLRSGHFSTEAMVEYWRCGGGRDGENRGFPPDQSDRRNAVGSWTTRTEPGRYLGGTGLR
jgi:hypothetical protein